MTGCTLISSDNLRATSDLISRIIAEYSYGYCMCVLYNYEPISVIFSQTMVHLSSILFGVMKLIIANCHVIIDNIGLWTKENYPNKFKEQLSLVADNTGLYSSVVEGLDREFGGEIKGVSIEFIIQYRGFHSLAGQVAEWLKAHAWKVC